jgi:hypothetical protein
MVGSGSEGREGNSIGEAPMTVEASVEQARAARPSGRGKFGISDGMIMIVGLAIALSASMHLIVLMADMIDRLWREASAHAGDLPGLPNTYWEAIRHPFRNTIWYGCQVADQAMIGRVPAWIVVRLRAPRASWRGLLRQPGTVAVLAMIFGLFWGTGILLILFPESFSTMSAAPSAVGGAVVLAWVVLASTRKWQAEPGWVDLVGRLLGCLAIGLAVLHALIYRI